MKNYKELQNGSDIRGVALEAKDGHIVNLGKDAAEDLSRAFATWLSEKCGKPVSALKIAIGRDSRLSGEFLLCACAESMAALGASISDCGMASTPAMFMSTVFEEIAADGAIMITASHLPFNRNGFKYFTKDGGLDKSDIKALIELAEGEMPVSGAKKGSVIPFDLMKLYSAHLRGIIKSGLNAADSEAPLAGMHIVCDAGNGAGGFYVKDVLEPLGADCSGSAFLEPDGHFPNHAPNPENSEAMEAICSAAKTAGADLGIIFDTDVDRAAAVDSKGRPIARNGIVALASALAAKDHPKTTIVTDSITSRQLGEFLKGSLGLRHLRFKRGYRNVINKAVKLNAEGTDCQLAIETSGHAALKENYFLDDGAYLATKIVIEAALLKQQGKSIESLISEMQEPLESSEFRLAVRAEDFAQYADKVLDELKALIAAGPCSESAPCNGRCRCGMSLEEPNYEGVRVNCDAENGNGWFLLRKSLHDPLMPLNIESDSPGGAAHIAARIKALLAPYGLLDTSSL